MKKSRISKIALNFSVSRNTNKILFILFVFLLVLTLLTCTKTSSKDTNKVNKPDEINKDTNKPNEINKNTKYSYICFHGTEEKTERSLYEGTENCTACNDDFILEEGRCTRKTEALEMGTVVVSGQGITSIALLSQTSVYYKFRKFFRIREDGESLFYRNIVRGKGYQEHQEPSVLYITRLIPKNENETGVFALEVHGANNNRVCGTTNPSLCAPLKVTVTREGFVAFYIQGILDLLKGQRKYIYTYDLKPQDIRVSFTSDTGEKTLQDISIQPAQKKYPIYQPPYRFEAGSATGIVVSGERQKTITLLPQTSVYYKFRQFFGLRSNGISRFYRGASKSQAPSIRYITRLMPKNENETGVFALEVHGANNNRVCSTTILSLCAPLKVTVTREGFVAFYTQEALDSQGERDYIFTYDLKPQDIQVSFTSDTGEKTLQDISIQPPETDCGTEMNSDRYNCLFQRGLRTDTSPEITTTKAHRSSLPDSMIYNRSQYQLIFNEEFNGEGMASLDNRIWTYSRGPARSASAPVLCENVRDGHYSFTKTNSCGADLTTEGKFSFKYGYFEVKYKVNTEAHNSYINMAMVLSYVHKGIRTHALGDYPNIKIDSIENLLKYVGTEFDLIEYVPNKRRQYNHVYIKRILGASRDIKQYSSKTTFPFCWGFSGDVDNRNAYFLPACSIPNAEFTITRSVEWTPSGYRNYIRVHDVHDKPQLFSDDLIEFRVNDDEDISPGFYFNAVRVGSRDLAFEQLGVMHVPAHFAMAAWGWPTTSRIWTTMKVDYIRIYQPTNHYDDMPLVYQ